MAAPPQTQSDASATPRHSQPLRPSPAVTRRRSSPVRRSPSTGAPRLSEPDPQPGTTRLGRTPGMRPIHAVVALVVAVAWAGVLAFVLTHGKDQGSGVDVYSELPAGFTAA